MQNSIIQSTPETPLRRVIRARGMKQGFLAKRIGVSDDRMSRWCRGDMEIDPKYIPVLAKELRVRQKDLRP